jgi:methyl-accepting chemotaxis protein
MRLHMLLTAGLVVLTFASIAALLIFVPLVSRFGAESPGSDAQAGLVDYLLFLHESFWPVVAGSILASMASGMALFERMRSPLRRFRSAYVQIAEGKIPEPISIRAIDYLRDETADFNRMVEALRQCYSNRERELEHIEHALHQLDVCDLPGKGASAVAEIQDAMARLHQSAWG